MITSILAAVICGFSIPANQPQFGYPTACCLPASSAVTRLSAIQAVCALTSTAMVRPTRLTWFAHLNTYAMAALRMTSPCRMRRSGSLFMTALCSNAASSRMRVILSLKPLSRFRTATVPERGLIMTRGSTVFTTTIRKCRKGSS